ncbi:MAG: hypothetical protein KDA24_12400 [Deltaproteobacteria bacterium]|nr:hypothetical protein [Deltaproteobacteria bacterium]
MKKLVSFAVFIALVYFASTTLFEEFTGPPDSGVENENKPRSLRDKASNAGRDDQKKKEDRINGLDEQ